jgi:exodeoxyribonuclease VII large subunit
MPDYTKTDILSVSQLCAKIKNIFTEKIGVITTTGEISSIMTAQSGHSYFTLKDEYAQIKCVYFKKYQTNFGPKISQGMKVQISGQISIYEGRGDLQLIAYRITPLGEGLLQLQFEDLKKKLLSQGIFDSVHKKSLPKFPKNIAVITSSKGAAIKDFCAISQKRFPLTKITIYDTPSQGKTAARYIIKALIKADQRNIFDAIILTRGGGSLEDLWCFNDENLALEIFSCKTPVISAIGHEIDFTISDFVADVRAATPSEAAEILLPDQNDIKQKTDYLTQILINKIYNIIANKKNILETYQKSLTHPKDKISIQQEKLNILKIKISHQIKNLIKNKKINLKYLTQKLDITSVQATLDRGYAIVKNNNNKIIDSIEKTPNNNKIKITVKDGEFGAIIKN